jgi:transcriptional regulator with XRE-family HTH domain
MTDRSTANIDTLIGERVRSRRIQAGMSQTTLAEALGVTFQQVQKYEKGTNRIGAGRLHIIAGVLECNVTDFFEGIGSTPTIVSTPFSEFMATKDGVAIIEAMAKIKNRALRRTVIDIAEKLAET